MYEGIALRDMPLLELPEGDIEKISVALGDPDSVKVEEPLDDSQKDTDVVCEEEGDTVRVTTVENEGLMLCEKETLADAK